MTPRMNRFTPNVIRSSAITRLTSWTDGVPSLDLFAGAPRRVITGGVVTQLPPGAVVLQVDRVTVAPGAAIPRHVHPGPEIMAGSSGTLTIYAAPPNEMTASSPGPGTPLVALEP